jgi:hypothetical protein
MPLRNELIKNMGGKKAICTSEQCLGHDFSLLEERLRFSNLLWQRGLERELLR